MKRVTERAHGTYARYVVDECRCDECRAANREYERNRARRIEPPYVSATAARKHLAELAAAGVGLKTVAKVTGLSHGALSKLVYGDWRGRPPSKRIRRSTHERILAVTPAAVRGSTRVDATATRGLLAEMVAAGVPKVQIAAALGAVSPGLQVARRSKVAADTARKVVELHARWVSGTWVPVRRDRWGNVTPIPAPAPVEVRRPAADISELLSELAGVVEARNDHARWRSSAACRGRPVHMWFPQRGDTTTMNAALRICAACMVREQCRAAHLGERVGIYGGLSAQARRRIAMGAAS